MGLVPCLILRSLASPSMGSRTTVSHLHLSAIVSCRELLPMSGKALPHLPQLRVRLNFSRLYMRFLSTCHSESDCRIVGTRTRQKLLWRESVTTVTVPFF